MEIKFKKHHKNAKKPKKAKKGDICFDVTAISRKFTFNYIEYDTGLSFEPPLHYALKGHSRSSISNKKLIPANCVGLIDNGYRGTVKFRFRYNIWSLIFGKIYKIGERIGQIEVIKIMYISYIISILLVY